ncbi:MAG: hypothetical protein GWM98_06545 [Nitrospinaceae bacterium]|nr:glycosyltransferase family 9 protein [Nitrospinaceae bacterium]NIR54213.1 glycosyltransferase family 9 protein [Nitrospinaceae bacterium]NIS84628.1 glycosyltransferase family 9 protein [Nitrospinaceae bacterium]NIT81423.1 glycosyltransferase family 9 protein [Nitrospinaceae bacterium]NIU43707.1 glycosyltransferase family 9 protein [Nitrospinaceae bacterium]
MSSLSRRLEKKIKLGLWTGLGFFLGSHPQARNRPDLSQIRSALVVRPDRLGDVVLSLPVYESLKKSIPGVRVTALVQAAHAEVLKYNPHVDRILAWNPARPWQIATQLRREKFDLALTLHHQFSATASLLTRASRARWRVGYDHPQNAWIHHLRVPVTGQPRHEIQNNLELLKALGLTSRGETPKLFFQPQEVEATERFLRQNRAHPDRPLVLIKPGTRIPEWGWAPGKFQEVTAELMRTGAAEVFIISGPGEEDWLNAFFEPLKVKPLRLSPMSLRQLACLLSQSDLLFCNHTGIMHLAAAVQTPTLIIFKHGEIARWGPRGNRHVLLEERGGDDLDPAAVLQHLRQMLTLEQTRTG